jgi:hypothetical protein
VGFHDRLLRDCSPAASQEGETMHKVLQDSHQLLLSLSAKELTVLTRIVTAAHHERPGADPEVVGMLEALNAEVHESRREDELVQVWEDQGVVMARVMSTFGDPVELNETEARAFADQLKQAISDAEAA